MISAVDTLRRCRSRSTNVASSSGRTSLVRFIPSPYHGYAVIGLALNARLLRPARGCGRMGEGDTSPRRAGMSVDRSYIARNEAQRARLRALVERLGDEQLARPMAGGWTVAAA